MTACTFLCILNYELISTSVIDFVCNNIIHALFATPIATNTEMLNCNMLLDKGAFNPQCHALAMAHCVFSEQLETAGAASSHSESRVSASREITCSASLMEMRLNSNERHLDLLIYSL